MKLEILGCSGGVMPGQGTTSFLIDETILIDAGTGLGELSFDRMTRIHTIFLTHSHLDHVCHLPFLLNNMIGDIEVAVDVYGLPHTIQAVKDHIFNDVIWPDFTKLPTKEKPIVKLHEIEAGQKVPVPNLGTDKVYTFTAMPVEHSVPTIGYHVANHKGSFAFSGDSSENESFWKILNQLPEVDLLIVDDQYLEEEKEISKLAKHYYSEALLKDLNKLNYHPKLYLTHLPPYKKDVVIEEANRVLKDWTPTILEPGMVISFPFEK